MATLLVSFGSCTCRSLRCSVVQAGPSSFHAASTTRAYSRQTAAGNASSKSAESPRVRQTGKLESTLSTHRYGRRHQPSTRRLARDFDASTSRLSRARASSPGPQADQSNSSFFPPASFTKTSKTQVDVQPFTEYSLRPSVKEGISKYFGGTLSPAPTPIQALVLQHMVGSAKYPLNKKPGQEDLPEQVLLGAGTGSGKTLAYLLPLLDRLQKGSQLQNSPDSHTSQAEKPIQSRALIVVPTHELARQITSVAKAVSRGIPIRIRGLSTTKGGILSLFKNGDLAVDVLVGTASSVAKGISKGHIAPSSVKWLVVDEADVLLGSDFQDEIEGIISAIRDGSGREPSTILSTATIPPSLVSHLDKRFSAIVKLLSPALHRLPPKLKTRFVAWSGSGNKMTDVAHEVKRVFSEDGRLNTKSRLLIFCNAANKVKALHKVLASKSVISHAMTGESEVRVPGANGLLDAFLVKPDTSKSADISPSAGISGSKDEIRKGTPRVLITTSLLSRGLDFSPSVKHVFLLDTPRDVLDFVHRAGRTGRAGNEGTVTVFGKGQRTGLPGRSSSASNTAKNNLHQWQSSTKLGQELKKVVGKRNLA